MQALSRVRAKEAQALLSLGLHDGAYYLAGYAVECGLKARICQDGNAQFLDKTHEHHNLRLLLRATQRGRQLPPGSEMDDVLVFLMLNWHVEMRYAIGGYTINDVMVFINRAEEVVKWLRLS